MELYNSVKGLETVALAKDTQSHMAAAIADLVIVDKVSYEGLEVGRNYKMVAELHDSVTGEVLLDSFGKEVRVEKEFAAKLTTGSIDMDIEYDATDYKNGGSVTVFEYLYDLDEGGETPIMKEADKTEANQQIHFPSLDSVLLNGESHMVKAGDDISLVDTITYDGFEAGKTYIISGKLMSYESKNVAVDDDGEIIKAKLYEETDEITTNKNGDIVFKPSEKSGTFKLLYNFNGKTLSGTLVSYIEARSGKTVIAEHKDITDTDQSAYIPSIKTTAVDMASDTHMMMNGGLISIKDTVKYTGLIPGEAYNVCGTLMDKETKEPFMVNGEKVTASKRFTAESSDGTVDVIFTFAADDMQGKSLVVFEELFDANGEIIADHTDIDDEDQTVYSVKIGTTATNKKDGTHYAAGEKTTVVDNVKYSGLIAGKEYEVKGTLMDKETGNPLLVDPVKGETDGNMVTASKKFTAEESDGSVDLEFTFDASLLCGKTIVVFERLYHNDKEIAYHTDINDDEQAIHVVGISTTALDEKTKSHTATYGKTVIIDEVSYDGVIPGIEYVLSGKLMDKSTKKALTNGKGNTVKTLVDKVTGKSNEYVSEIKFTPSSTKGTVTVKFEIDTSMLAGKSIVVYEKMYANGKLIAKHEDINSSSQTVTVSKNPKIGTKAYDKATKGKVVTYGDKVSVIDTVSYENLETGKKYTLTGKLVDKSTKNTVKLVSGGKGSKMEKNTVTLTFTPKKSSGTVDMEFVINAKDLAGKSLVAFEYVKLDDKVIAKHEDLNSTSQTVTVPSVSTKATVDGKKVAKRSKNTVIIDSVSYKNLEKGKTYTIKGVLMDKKTRKSTGVTATARVTAKDTNGSEDVKFTVDTSKYDELVVFEEIYYGNTNTLIGEHRDINDKDQAVTFSDTETPPDTVQTGVSSMLMILLMIVLLGGAAGVFFFKKKIK